MVSYVENQAVEDEIRYLDIGIQDDRDFFSYKLGGLGLSYSDDFQTEYKIAGFSVFRNFDRIVFGRATYDFLAFLGDVGGLEGITLLIGGSMISRYTSFLLTVTMMPYIFYFRKNALPLEIEKHSSLRVRLNQGLHVRD